MSRKPPRSREPAKSEGLVWLYGRHAVSAALRNQNRRPSRILATKNAVEWLKMQDLRPHWRSVLEDAKPAAIDAALPTGAVHQGLAARFNPLPRMRLKDVCSPSSPERPVLVLDQITDPQNIGALFRSAAAFGARAVIVQDRRTPPLAGALAKAAAGSIETLPCVSVVNISRALEALQDLGYHCAGLAGDAANEISDIPPEAPTALVMGAEGSGLRERVAGTCDALYRIPIADEIESLNVSNAASVTLYQIQKFNTV